MLDLHISFAERWHRCCLLDVGMHFKSTAQGVALDSTSDHPMSVHAWPLARIRHFEEMCSSRTAYRQAALTFLRKMVTHTPSHSYIGTLIDRIEGHKCFLLGDKTLKIRSGSWLVLPFHRSLVTAGIGAAIHRVSKDWLSGRFAEYAPGISWRLEDRNLLQFMQSSLQTKIK